ncbi:PTPLA-domain-containing protein [Phanerochaete sordida]|uniref:Very-long-chain (3R)-3-hydroxyacyl-CoA dehydratase n=1 Tax=Phanerochaete sordida TaxID=48140 RepID=A0A9P3GGC4_9APHY|nr:PTPLA-domain-containing protein [Phanerochaete sordida]
MAKIEEWKESPKPAAARGPKGPSPLLKAYLVAYNLVSAAGWAYVLFGAAAHLLDGRAPGTPAGWLAPRFAAGHALEAYVPAGLAPLLRRAAATHAAVGARTAAVQTLAVLEVVHALLRWVRSPLPTVGMQVFSRLFVVWGVVHFFPVTHTHPAYASMVLSWAFTEVVRYVFYACTLLGTEPAALLWLRYTTFWVLYPTGASSEAALIWSTLPPLADLASWGPADYFRGAMFCIWWPSLYVLYTHMIKQRRRVLGVGPGRTLGAKPKSQ